MAIDKGYSREAYKRILRLGGEKFFFENVVVSGKENLSSERQRIYLANHLSHMDYALIWLLSHRDGFKMPVIAAGKNLDLRLFRMIGFDFGRLGGEFIDRELLSNGNGSFSDRRDVYRRFRNIVSGGEDLLVFPEGGRNYHAEEGVMNSFYEGILRAALSGADVDRTDLVLLAFDYDRKVEDGFLDKIERHRKDKNWRYYFWDAAAYASHFAGRQFCDRGDAYVSVGSPRKIGEIFPARAGMEQRVGAVRDYSVGGIRELYEGIRKC